MELIMHLVFYKIHSIFLILIKAFNPFIYITTEIVGLILSTCYFSIYPIHFLFLYSSFPTAFEVFIFHFFFYQLFVMHSLFSFSFYLRESICLPSFSIHILSKYFYHFTSNARNLQQLNLILDSPIPCDITYTFTLYIVMFSQIFSYFCSKRSIFKIFMHAFILYSTALYSFPKFNISIGENFSSA